MKRSSNGGLRTSFSSWKRLGISGACAVLAVAAGWFVHLPHASVPVNAQARPRVEMSAGSCNFDMTGDKATTVFFVLGFLDEYLGRHIVEGGDRVEGFYCNEGDKAAMFRRYLDRLASEQGIDPTIREETTQGCLVSYYSKPLTDALNSCYRYTPTGSSWVVASDGTRRWVATGVLNDRLFYRSGAGTNGPDGLSDSVFNRTRSLAYLAGAWVRYGEDPSFHFANADDKAKRIAQLLVDLGARRVRLESTFGLIPRSNWVHFDPNQQLLDWLQRSW